MKFLIVKTSSLGDIVHAFDALSFLRQNFPYSTIDWVVEEPFKDLPLAHPAIDTVFLVETKKWRKGKNLHSLYRFFRQLRGRKYDYIFDFQGNIKSSFLLALTSGKNKVGFGWKSVPEWPNCFFTSLKINPPKGGNIREDYVEMVRLSLGLAAPYTRENVSLKLTGQERKLLESLPEGPPKRVLVAPGSAWVNKEVDPDTLVEFLRQDDEAFFLFSWGSEREKKTATWLQGHFPDRSLLLPKMTLPLLQNVMGRCALVVAMDSLPLHLCGTTQTPSFSFFGPSHPGKYVPLGSHHRYTWGSCPYGIHFTKRCPRLRTCETGACIKKLQIAPDNKARILDKNCSLSV